MTGISQSFRGPQEPMAAGESGASGHAVQTVQVPRGRPEGEFSQRIRILVADDHHVLREGVVQRLGREQDFDVVAQASDGEEAVRLAVELSPDVLVLDIGMPKLSGLEVTKRIKMACPGVAILVLTVHDDEQHILDLLRAGASGYHSKTTYGNELVQAIRSVAIGHVSLQCAVATKLVALADRYAVMPTRQKAGNLTPRELEVLRLAANGFRNREIAPTLGLKTRSVKGHLTSIFAKLGVETRTEMVLAALKTRLLNLNDVASPSEKQHRQAAGNSTLTDGYLQAADEGT